MRGDHLTDYSAVAVVIECWGEDAPDWIRALARECDAASNAAVAERIGRTASVVSQVLRAKYRGSMPEVERRVRGAFLGETVSCPVLGEIGGADCAKHQDQPLPGGGGIAARLYRACRSGCPSSRLSPYDHIARRRGR